VRTAGLSNKLYASAGGIVIGLVLVLIGERTTGVSILVTAAASLGLGYAAPADVQHQDQHN